jgi:hypothetical protein
MRLISFIVLMAALSGCANTHSPPKFAISVPAAFSGQTERREYPVGVPLTDDSLSRQLFPNYRAEHPTTKLFGRWTDPSFVSYPARGTYYGQAKYRGWSVEVQQGSSPKVLRALQAKDGYEADLGFNIDASARIYPRFRHKTFSWGEAVSFLVQYQNDNTNYVPNNGMLLYEAHGVTRDHRYTVKAQFGVTHPALTEFGPRVRDYRDDSDKPDSAMRQDPDYLLVENCPDDAFQPSIAAIDDMLDTLKPGASP